MGKSMGTVDKAFHLLSCFTVTEPEWGLSDLARRAGQDKATALRLLNSLMAGGFVEQDPDARTFRIGTAVLKLARVREASFPFLSLAKPPSERLSASIGETIHVCLPEADALATVHIVEPQRATRVYVDPSQPLPYHATASGLAFLAFASAEFVDHALSSTDFRAHTEHTITSREVLIDALAKIRGGAYAVSSSSFELETIGIASPIFDASGHAMGTVAAACLASRITPELETRIASAVTGTAIEITRALGAEPPARFIQSHRELGA
ncbi:IclR family transcriptional regulator [Oceaniglobus roseus]|uniref:IclR family transcriptional regulator n=1 Tax=Oceaniglobus roseus TaxID=1737570 RepID=UPI001C12B613|nr:IclR family transcriptional regulator [Kandeliimicrobium roseum]